MDRVEKGEREMEPVIEMVEVGLREMEVERHIVAEADFEGELEVEKEGKLDLE